MQQSPQQQWQPCQTSINAFIREYQKANGKKPSVIKILDYAGVQDTPQNRQIAGRL